MAAPARWLSPDRPWQNGDAGPWYVSVRNVDGARQPIGITYETTIDRLSNGEVIKACTAVGLNHKTWTTKAERIRAIHDQLAWGQEWNPRNVKIIEPAPIPDADPELERLLAEEEEIQRRTPDPVKADAVAGVSALETMFAAMIADAVKAAGIDETKVRALIVDETKTLRPHITKIQLEGREPVEVEGRQHAQFSKLLKLLAIGENVFLVGPMGTGKTTMAEQAAEALGLPFYAMSCAGQLPSAFWGYSDANGTYQATNTRRAYEHGGVMLYDELDAGTANAMTAVNMLTANAVCAFPDGMVKRHPEFRVVATANTYGTGATAEYVGRNILDAATLDRFAKLPVPIDDDLEADMVRAWLDKVQADEWLARIKRYRTNIATHGLKVGVSPRATVSGAKMIANGFTVQDALDIRVLPGMADDVRRKVEA